MVGNKLYYRFVTDYVHCHIPTITYEHVPNGIVTLPPYIFWDVSETFFRIHRVKGYRIPEADEPFISLPTKLIALKSPTSDKVLKLTTTDPNCK